MIHLLLAFLITWGNSGSPWQPQNDVDSAGTALNADSLGHQPPAYYLIDSLRFDTNNTLWLFASGGFDTFKVHIDIDTCDFADTSGHSKNPAWAHITGGNSRGFLAIQIEDGNWNDTLIWHMAERFDLPIGENFVLTEAVGYGEIDSATLNRMQQAGVEIGSHSYTHPYLHTLTQDSVEWELYHSKKRLEEIIIDPTYHCKCFSYPYDARTGADSVVSAVRRHYLFARGSGNVNEDSGTGLIEDWDPAHCFGQVLSISVGWDSATNAGKIDSVLARVRDENWFLTWFLHGTDVPANIDTTLLRQVFRRISEWRDSINIAHFSEINEWLSTNDQNTRMSLQKYLYGVEIYGPDTGLKVTGEVLAGHFNGNVAVEGSLKVDHVMPKDSTHITGKIDNCVLADTTLKPDSATVASWDVAFLSDIRDSVGVSVADQVKDSVKIYHATILDPDAYQSTLDTIMIGSTKLGASPFYLDSVGIETDASSSYSVVWILTPAIGTAGRVLKTTATSASVSADSSVGTVCGVDSLLCVIIPDTDIRQLGLRWRRWR